MRHEAGRGSAKGTTGKASGIRTRFFGRTTRRGRADLRLGDGARGVPLRTCPACWGVERAVCGTAAGAARGPGGAGESWAGLPSAGPRTAPGVRGPRWGRVWLEQSERGGGKGRGGGEGPGPVTRGLGGRGEHISVPSWCSQPRAAPGVVRCPDSPLGSEAAPALCSGDTKPSLHAQHPACWHPRPALLCLGFPVRPDRGPCRVPGSGPASPRRASRGGPRGAERPDGPEPLVSLERQTPRSSAGGQGSRRPRVEGAQ